MPGLSLAQHARTHITAAIALGEDDVNAQATARRKLIAMGNPEARAAAAVKKAWDLWFFIAGPC